MARIVQIALVAFLVSTGLAIWFLVWQTVQSEKAIADAAVSLKASADDLPEVTARLSDTLDAINAPCVGFHGSETCGPLAQLSQTEKNIGIVAGLAALQVKQSATLVNSASVAVTSATQDVHTMAQAGTETLNTATETLGEGKRTIAAAQPLLSSLTRATDASTLSIQHFDVLLTSKDLATAMRNSASMTASGAEIMVDAKRVADDATRKYFRPTPWYRKAFPFLTTGAKIASYALPW